MHWGLPPRSHAAQRSLPGLWLCVSVARGHNQRSSNSVFNEINRTKMKLLEENSCKGHVMTTATGGIINRYLQKLGFTRLYTHVRFDYAYAHQMYHRHYTAGLEYRFGAHFDTLKQVLQDERNYNFILIQPTKSAIERGKNQEFWKMNCPKCSSKNNQVLYDNNGEYCWCV